MTVALLALIVSFQLVLLCSMNPTFAQQTFLTPVCPHGPELEP